MEPRIIEKGPIHLVGVLTPGAPNELNYDDIWAKQFMKFDALLQPYSVDKAYYGAWFGEQGSQAYLAGMAVEGIPEVPAGLVARELPAVTYAIFECTMATIGATYTHIYQEWLPASSYVVIPETADFEYYPADMNANSPAIYVPIRSKK